MSTLSHFLAAAALMASAVIYGTDVFCAIVQRPALAQVSDRALTSVMGRVHEYGDRRLPLPGALGITAAALATVTAAIAGHAAAAATAATAVTAQAVWLIIYLRVSAPVNRAHGSRQGRIRPGRRPLPPAQVEFRHHGPRHPAGSGRRRAVRRARRPLEARPPYPYTPEATEAISRRPHLQALINLVAAGCLSIASAAAHPRTARHPAAG